MGRNSKKQKTSIIWLLIVFLSMVSFTAAAQNITLSGQVTDKGGLAVIGASVAQKGTTNGVMTDLDGNYTISVPKDATIVFSYIGMVTQDVKVDGRSVINVVLQDEAVALDDVVVIGYGVQKRRDLTGSISSVTAEDIAVAPVSNVAQALQGRMPGVSIVSMDGRPDASMKIRVRGGTSITQSNDPLYIVDGFPVNNIDDIPADQIASIDILKDASSTAIYGARGANGVVLVTTKTPKGGKLSITYDGYVQLKNPTERHDMMNPYEYVLANWEYATLFNTNNGTAWARAMGIGDYTNWNNGAGIAINNPSGIDAYKNMKGRSAEKEIIDNAFSQSHNIGISGGSEKTKYSLSFNYLNDEGLKINSSLKKVNLMAKISQTISNTLKLDFDARYSDRTAFGDEGYRNGQGTNITRALRYIPVTPLGDISDSNTDLNMYQLYIGKDYDPVTIVNDVYNKRNWKNFRANVALTWDILKDLTYKTELGVNKTWSDEYYFEGRTYRSAILGSNGSMARINKNEYYGYRYVNTLNYNFSNLGDDHRLGVLLGQELSAFREGDKSTSISVQGFPETFDAKRAFAMMGMYKVQGINYEPQISTVNAEPERLVSFFGRVNYSFKDRYLLTATFRADGSTKFRPGNQWGFFPAAALAWRLSDESFMESTRSWIDNLKVRLSYGEVGNNRVNSGLWKSIYIPITDNRYLYSINNSLQPGYDLNNNSYMPNRDLKWETTVTRNIGVDYSFLNGRVFGALDFYRNTTDNLLVPNFIPGFTGYTRMMENIGKTRNQGVEFAVGGDIIRKKDFTLSANFNISFNKNKILKLADNDMITYSSAWGSTNATNEYMMRKGGSFGEIRGYVYDGWYTTDDFNYDTATGVYTLKPDVANNSKIVGSVPNGAYPGKIKFKKMSGTGTEINEAEDVVKIGDTNPDHIGGFNLSGMYKGFDFLVGFNWSYGNDVLNIDKVVNSYGAKTLYRNWNKSFENRYRIFDVQNGQLVKVTDPNVLNELNKNARTYMPYHEQPVTTSEAVEDGSFLRLNNITVGYTLPAKLTRKFMVEKLRVYATVYNVWIWTDYSGYDPEVDTGDNNYATSLPLPGLDFGSYPKARTFTFGVNLSF
ncbi:MAG: SusC/RagA family TonB-linked outer membrane protein [Dysgonomonas sp.]